MAKVQARTGQWLAAVRRTVDGGVCQALALQLREVGPEPLEMRRPTLLILLVAGGLDVAADLGAALGFVPDAGTGTGTGTGPGSG